MDSANACDGYGVNQLTKQYTQQYQQLLLFMVMQPIIQL